MFKLFTSRSLLGQINRGIRQCSSSSVRTMTTSNTGLSIDYDGDLAIIKMEKDDNRLNQDFFNIFHDFLDQVEGNSAIKGLITTGNGKFFSNGLDMEWMATLPRKDMIDFMNSFLHFVRRILMFPVPNLAAINGHAFAGGAVMAFAQDFRVMNAEKGWICFNEVHLNKRFFGFLGSLLRQKVGAGLNTNDALIYGRRYTAEKALENKLIHSKTSSSTLLEHSSKLLRSYMVGKDGFSREAVRNAKEDIYAGCLVQFDTEIKNIKFAEQFMVALQLLESGK